MQAVSLIEAFKARSIVNNAHFLRLTRTWLLASGISSGINYQAFLVNNTWQIRHNLPAPPAFNICACAVAYNCPDSTWTGGQFLCDHGNNCTAGTIAWSVPGFVKGCTVLEQIFSTDLRCFFDETCFNTLLSMYNVDMPNRTPLPADVYTITTMNRSLPSRFSPTDAIETIFDEMMLEEWTILNDFSGYYETCAPSLCTYTITRRLDVIYVVSVVIGLFGGLSVTFRLIVPVATQMLHWISINWLQRRLNHNARRNGIV